MAATAWQLYNTSKRYIGNGTITLGAGSFKMALARTSSNASTFTLSTFGSITAQISATGGYVSGGKELVPATGQWTTGASATQMKFTYSTVGLTFTASGASLTNVRYAVITHGASASCGFGTETSVLLPIVVCPVHCYIAQYFDGPSRCNRRFYADLICQRAGVNRPGG
jgi:hypothetical protein